MTYNITIRKTALKFIQKQDRNNQKRLFTAIKGLPNTGDVKKMSGYASLYRLRVRNYRILFKVSPLNKEITLIDVMDADNR